MLTIEQNTIIKRAAVLDPIFAAKYNIPVKRNTQGRAVGTSFLVQGGQYVTAVQPGTPIQLFTNDLVAQAFGWGQTEFTVIGPDGNVVSPFPQNVAVNMAGNAWYDWTAPTTEGSYTFYGNTSDESNQFVTFNVSKNAPTPTENGNPSKTNWLLIGGIGIAVLAGIVLFTTRR